MRPSSGDALRAFGKEIAKRSGAAGPAFDGAAGAAEGQETERGERRRGARERTGTSVSFPHGTSVVSDGDYRPVR